MATPNSIRSAAFSIVKNSLSPRNPTYLEIPSPKIVGFQRNHIRSPQSRKCLNFSEKLKGKTSNYLNVFDIKNPGVFFDEKPNKIEKKESIVINTPTKLDLMKNGLSDSRRLLDVLGRGSFGTVVKGFYGDAQVAVKITKGNDKSVESSDINCQGLLHENIVQVLEIIMKPEAEHAIIIMEYLEGAKNLQSLLESSSILNYRTKKRYIEQICSGLQYCHESGLLHLDVKPKNIMVLPNEQCKICDFGNSCRIENRKNYVYQGTAAYAAPELLRGMVPTEKSDIYSLGITIWQIEYRKNPYESWGSSKCLVYNVVKNNVRPEYESRNDGITNIFVSCWDQNPMNRPDLGKIHQML